MSFILMWDNLESNDSSPVDEETAMWRGQVTGEDNTAIATDSKNQIPASQRCVPLVSL